MEQAFRYAQHLRTSNRFIGKGRSPIVWAAIFMNDPLDPSRPLLRLLPPDYRPPSPVSPTSSVPNSGANSSADAGAAADPSRSPVTRISFGPQDAKVAVELTTPTSTTVIKPTAVGKSAWENPPHRSKLIGHTALPNYLPAGDSSTAGR
jgi:hypothetical protein